MIASGGLGPSQSHKLCSKRRAIRRLRIPLLLTALIVGGCANFSSHQTETATDGVKRETQIHVWTLFDAHSDVTKLRASTTDKTQGMSLAGLDQSASSTNLVRILELVAALAAASAK